MIATHKIEAVKFDNDNLVLQIDGVEFRFPLYEISPKLQSASEIQKNIYTISPSGYGIHWPLIDEDLSISSLLKSAKH